MLNAFYSSHFYEVHYLHVVYHTSRTQFKAKLVGEKYIITVSYLMHVLRISVNLMCMLLVQLNLDRLLAKMWEEMGLVRVYTKPQGQQPDFSDPVVLSAVCHL